jgi:UDP-N-acetylglucosamine--N-acetylmuramyl-(pentapeptide) pyrophosphoryl-undecaprenol N-acetylglucosamine transferase
MKIAVTGGGTGGHLAIARALQEALVARGHEAIFIGSTSGQDRMWFDAHSGFSHVYFLETTGVVNRRGLGKLAAVWRIFKAMLASRRLLERHGIQGVISVGGFSAAPASLAALSRAVPLFIHEQNAVTGRLNRMLRPFARYFFSAYDDASPLKDYPVSEAIFETARVRERLDTLIFLGGSQGARFINDLALRVAPRLRERGIAVIHQCGERDYERVRDAYAAMELEVELVAFSKEMPALLSRSDFAVCRAGASTLWELCAGGIPALYVPYPYAAGDHQYHNARFLETQGLGWCERQEGDVEGRLFSLLDEPLASRSEQLMLLCHPKGADAMIGLIEEAV